MPQFIIIMTLTQLILFTILYAFIFILVKAEQTSLLMGLIWLILAVTMYLTRKVDWYKINDSQ